MFDSTTLFPDRLTKLVEIRAKLKKFLEIFCRQYERFSIAISFVSLPAAGSCDFQHLNPEVHVTIVIEREIGPSGERSLTTTTRPRPEREDIYLYKYIKKKQEIIGRW